MNWLNLYILWMPLCIILGLTAHLRFSGRADELFSESKRRLMLCRKRRRNNSELLFNPEQIWYIRSWNFYNFILEKERRGESKQQFNLHFIYYYWLFFAFGSKTKLYALIHIPNAHIFGRKSVKVMNCFGNLRLSKLVLLSLSLSLVFFPIFFCIIVFYFDLNIARRGWAHNVLSLSYVFEIKLWFSHFNNSIGYEAEAI